MPTEKHLTVAAQAIADIISARGNMPGTNFMQAERVDEARAAIDAYLRSVLEGTEVENLAAKLDDLACKEGCGFFYETIRAAEFIRAQAASLSEAQERCAGMEKDMELLRTEPGAVHIALLRGDLAKPSIRTMLHAYGAEALQKWDAAALPQPLPAQPPLEDAP